LKTTTKDAANIAMRLTYLFLQFDGRISRKPYWIAFCLLSAAGLTSWFLTDHFGGERLSSIIELMLMYPELAVIIKRAHDREMPLWIPILYFSFGVLANAVVIFGLGGSKDEPGTPFWIVSLPLLAVALYLFVDLGFFKGVRGPNRFGPDPLERQT